jgi:hypothetical protein
MKEALNDLLSGLLELRPRDFRVQIVNPAGEITHEAKFATKDEAEHYVMKHRQERDLAITRHTPNSCENN